mgnify:CR=1 FL=1
MLDFIIFQIFFCYKNRINKIKLKQNDKSIYDKSIEALASDKHLPSYIFEGPGEILSIKEEYAHVRWRRPVPDVWFKLEQIKEYTVAE